MNNQTTTPWWRNGSRLPLVAFFAIAGYFLWTEHQAHVIQYLPWILILACVGMHFFMHGGHGSGHDRSIDHDAKQPTSDTGENER
jgi:hypothetical protein